MRFMSHSYRKVHIFIFLSFQCVVLSYFLPFFLSFHLFSLSTLYFFANFPASILSISVRNIIFHFHWILEEFYKYKTALSNACYVIFIGFHYPAKLFPFLTSTLPCSFILYTSDNRSFDKAIFRLIYTSLQIFLLLNFSL